MSQTIAIILRFDKEKASEFERMFEQEVLPLWKEFKAKGKFLSASLTPVDLTQFPSETQDYILHVETAGMSGHHEFDSDARFMEFLARAKEMQPQEPLVWFGDTLFQV